MSKMTEYLLWGFLLFSFIFLGGELIAGLIIDTAFYSDCRQVNGVAIKDMNGNNVCVKFTATTGI